MLGVCRSGPVGRPVSAPLVRDERDAWAVLASVDGIGPVRFAALLARFGTAGDVLAAAGSGDGRRALEIEGGLGRDGEPVPLGFVVTGRLSAAVATADAFLARLRAADIEPLVAHDPAYPARLRQIELPPHVLFVRGDPAALSLGRAVAIVGTRRPSEDGRRIAARIAAAAARLGAGVVSGLAVGIDGAAHAAVVAERSPTVAVLAGGHEHLFPRAHGPLAEKILSAGGAVVTELPPYAEASRGAFPRRNRIISGLADATVVVEASARSGALITAGWALEQGRDCFLVPGRLGDDASAGCLAFLRAFPDAARIVAGVPELLEDLGLVGRAGVRTVAVSIRPAPSGTVPAEAVLVELPATERRLAEALIAGRTTADELVATTGLEVATVLGALTLLEIRGLVVAALGRYRPAGRLASVEPERPRSRGTHPAA